MMFITRKFRGPMALSLVLVLSACASTFRDEAVQEVASTTQAKTGIAASYATSEKERDVLRVQAKNLLAQPLGMDDAVKVALLNNRGLQASFAELGIAAADLAAASRPPNPGFAYSKVMGSGELEIERHVSVNVLGYLTFPINYLIEQRRFEQSKLRAAGSVLQLAAETRRAWIRAVAAQQIVAFVEQAKDAAEAQATLARRMRQVGNFSTLDAARQQAFYAESAGLLSRARLTAASEREALTRLLGLWGDNLGYALSPRLPELPEKIDEATDIEMRAIAGRYDIQVAKSDTDALRKSLDLSRATRFVNVLEAGYLSKTDRASTPQKGFEVSFEVPIFDLGDARVSRAEQTYMQTVNRLAELAVNARSEARSAYVSYRTAYDIARHYRDEVVPLRKRISEEMLLRYNGMLIGVFELLTDARDQIAMVVAAIESARDFWLAETNLQFVTLIDGGDREGMRPSRPAMSGGTTAAAH